jgi:hypothetical protein
MSNLSADAPLKVLGDAFTEKFILDSSGSYTVYKGCGLVLDANVDTLYAHTAASLTLVTGDTFLGIACEKKAVVSGDTEDTEHQIEAYVQPTIVGFKSAVFTEADLGKTVAMSDTGTLTASTGAYPTIGKLHRVKDGYAYVRLDTPHVMTV